MRKQKGQIVTVLTLIALGVMSVGALVAGKAVKNPSSPFFSEASNCSDINYWLNPSSPNYNTNITVDISRVGASWCQDNWNYVGLLLDGVPQNLALCDHLGNNCDNMYHSTINSGEPGTHTLTFTVNNGSCICNSESFTTTSSEPTNTPPPNPTDTPTPTTEPTATPTTTPTTTPESTVTPGGPPTSTPTTTPTVTPTPKEPEECQHQSIGFVRWKTNGTAIVITPPHLDKFKISSVIHTDNGETKNYPNQSFNHPSAGEHHYSTTNLSSDLIGSANVTLEVPSGWKIIDSECYNINDYTQEGCASNTGGTAATLINFKIDCGTKFRYGWILEADCSNCASSVVRRYPSSLWDENNNGQVDDCHEACLAYFGEGISGHCGNPGSNDPYNCCSCNIPNDCSVCVQETDRRYPESVWDENDNGDVDNCRESCKAYFGSECTNVSCSNPGSTDPTSCCGCSTATGASCATLSTPTPRPGCNCSSPGWSCEPWDPTGKDPERPGCLHDSSRNNPAYYCLHACGVGDNYVCCPPPPGSSPTPTPTPTPQVCPQEGISCTDEYPQKCCTNGSTDSSCQISGDGTQICHKKGTCQGIGGGNKCSWGPGSYCGACVAEGAAPTPVPLPTGCLNQTQLIDYGGVIPYGYCTTVSAPIRYCPPDYILQRDGCDYTCSAVIDGEWHKDPACEPTPTPTSTPTPAPGTLCDQDCKAKDYNGGGVCSGIDYTDPSNDSVCYYDGIDGKWLCSHNYFYNNDYDGNCEGLKCWCRTFSDCGSCSENNLDCYNECNERCGPTKCITLLTPTLTPTPTPGVGTCSEICTAENQNYKSKCRNPVDQPDLDTYYCEGADYWGKTCFVHRSEHTQAQDCDLDEVCRCYQSWACSNSAKSSECDKCCADLTPTPSVVPEETGLIKIKAGLAPCRNTSLNCPLWGKRPSSFSVQILDANNSVVSTESFTNNETKTFSSLPIGNYKIYVFTGCQIDTLGINALWQYLVDISITAADKNPSKKLEIPVSECDLSSTVKTVGRVWGGTLGAAIELRLATVEIEGLTGLTDEEGLFQIFNVTKKSDYPIVDYHLKIEADGYQTLDENRKPTGFFTSISVADFGDLYLAPSSGATTPTPTPTPGATFTPTSTPVAATTPTPTPTATLMPSCDVGLPSDYISVREGVDTVDLVFQDNADDENGFDIQRRIGVSEGAMGGWSDWTSRGARGGTGLVESPDDTNAPDTQCYQWRVRSTRNFPVGCVSNWTVSDIVCPEPTDTPTPTSTPTGPSPTSTLIPTPTSNVPAHDSYPITGTLQIKNPHSVNEDDWDKGVFLYTDEYSGGRIHEGETAPRLELVPFVFYDLENEGGGLYSFDSQRSGSSTQKLPVLGENILGGERYINYKITAIIGSTITGEALINTGSEPFRLPQIEKVVLALTVPTPTPAPSLTFTPTPTFTITPTPTPTHSPTPTQPDSPSQIVSRDGWGANQALSERMKSNPGIKATIIHHTAAVTDTGQNETPILRNIQHDHMNNEGWGDIAYHYLIGPSGTIYEGRDPQYAGDTRTNYDPAGYLHICLLGNFNKQEPTTAALASLKSLLQGHVYGHRELAATACPGESLQNWLESGATLATTDQACNNDGIINMQDYNIVINNYGGTGVGDVNADGVVNASDLSNLLQFIGQSVE